MRSVQAFGIQGERQHSDAPTPPPAVGLHGLPDGIQDGNGAERQGPAGQSTPRWAGGEAERAHCRRRSFIPYPFPIGRGGRRVSVGKHDGGTQPAHAWWGRPTGSGSYLALGTGLLACPASADRGPGGAWPALDPGVAGWLAPRGTLAFSWPSEAGIISKLGESCQRRKKRIVPCSERVHKAPVLKLVSPG